MSTHEVIARCNASGIEAIVRVNLSEEEVKLLNRLGDRIRAETDWDLDLLALVIGKCDTVAMSTAIPHSRKENSEHDGMCSHESADREH
jgi:hypothetical protein